MKFIMPILLGAVIGYITNWLAIKMLFRPHYEKKIFGLHIPFTPGLIPKEMNRIAKSIGETVGVHLLSPEIVTEALSNNGVNCRIKTWVENNINAVKESNMTIKALLISFVGDNYDRLLSVIMQRLTCFVCSQLREQKFKDSLINMIESKVYDRYSEDIYKAIKEKAEILMYNLSTSEEVKMGLKSVISDKIKELEYDTRSLNEVIPSDIINAVNLYVNEHSKDIAGMLSEMLKSPSVKTRLKSSISELVSQNTNKLVTIFMSPETIAEKVFVAIEKYISNPDNNKDIVLIVTTSTNKLLQSKVSNIVTGISPEDKEQYACKIVEVIAGYISNRENQSKLIGLAEEKILASEKDIKESLLNAISSKLEDILNSPKLYENANMILSHIVEIVLNEPVSYVLKDVDKEAVANIADFAKDIFDSFIRNKLPHIIEILNISKVVEDQINNFDVAFAEQIIIEIANNELRAITWLGALLGGIMGILLPLLQL